MNQYHSVREYAKRYLELCNSERPQGLRTAWAEHHNLNFARPLIYIRQIPYNEFFDFSLIKSEDPLIRSAETMFATSVLFRQNLKDDFVFEPWYEIFAIHKRERDLRWGISASLGEMPQEGGAAAYAPGIIEEVDIERLLPVKKHEIDEEKTNEIYEKLNDAFGDIIPIYVKRTGLLASRFGMDISTDLAKIRGLEQIMWDVYDRPEWLHSLLGKMRDAIIQNHKQTEGKGDFTTADSENQCIPYAKELPNPGINNRGVSTKQLWGFVASQETTTFSPEMFDEFMLEYQLPIMELYGLIAYGCCEDLTNKIHLLRKISNLRRIAVSPFANVQKCAEQIQSDYILSYRPNPSDMIAMGLDETYVANTMSANFRIFKENNCKFDITLKDVETISGKPQNLIDWVKIVRREIEKAF